MVVWYVIGKEWLPHFEVHLAKLLVGRCLVMLDSEGNSTS
jgi:hypothetical protein